MISSGLDEMYKKFGALIVDSWDEVTEELLASHEKVEVPDEIFKVKEYTNTIICVTYLIPYGVTTKCTPTE